MRVSTPRLLAWCGPCLPVAALGLPLVVYLPPYFAGTLGLPLATVGFLFFLVRAIDVPLDPVIGALMDNTRTRWGRFRPWVVCGSLVLAAGTWGLFMAEPGITAVETFAWLFLLYLGLSMTYLAHTSWGATLSPDYAERARIFGWWTAANVVGMLLVLGIPPLTSSLVAGNSPSEGIHAMGWFIIALLPITALIAVRVTGNGAAAPESHKVRWRDVVRVLKDGRMARLLSADLMLSVAPGITGALFVFFFTAARGYTTGQSQVLLLVYFVAGLLGAPLWIRAAARWGKHRALAGAALWFAAAQCGVLLVPRANMAFAIPGMAIAGACYAAAPFLLRAMMADLIDAQRLEAGGRSDATGLNYAILTATAKIGYGIPVGVTFPLLALVGFDPKPGAANTPDAIFGLEMIFLIPTVALGLIAAWIARGWPITATEHARIREALDEIDGARLQSESPSAIPATIGAKLAPSAS